ncbi:MAG TPA: hypothetical protein G4O14_06780 [Anaerolineae bacterium]|nr:hypothetical protein [Anaerolineae bacterium]
MDAWGNYTCHFVLVGKLDKPDMARIQPGGYPSVEMLKPRAMLWDNPTVGVGLPCPNKK